MKTQTKLKAMMKSYGFTLHRKTNHFVWRDANGVQIVTGKTISDHRAIANIEKTIARARAKRANSQTAH
jgi:hypothetical protein